MLCGMTSGQRLPVKGGGREKENQVVLLAACPWFVLLSGVFSCFWFSGVSQAEVLVILCALEISFNYRFAWKIRN